MEQVDHFEEFFKKKKLQVNAWLHIYSLVKAARSE